MITGEYPPQPGGVSDYCEQLAKALSLAGDQVHVWTAPTVEPSPPADDSIIVHRLESHFGIDALRSLGDLIQACPPPRRVLVQYVANAFGCRAMNVPFCIWLRRYRADPVWVMFHEYAYRMGWRARPAVNLLGAVTHVMGSMAANRADRIFVSTPAWEKRLPFRRGEAIPPTWLPIPSNLPVRVEEAAVAATRQRVLGKRVGTIIGHFGTYSPLIRPILAQILPALLRPYPDRTCLLVGRDSDDFAREVAARYPEFAHRLVATGGLSRMEASTHLKACDILVQPYPDGATSRRGSLMAGLALGLPIVTNVGQDTEEIWRREGAVMLADGPSPQAMIAATENLLGQEQLWKGLSEKAGALYQTEFSLERTVATLRAQAAEEEKGAHRG